ncbi:cytochrome P450 monooxygenase-like protein [Macrophomina phaseolina]|uniref:Cytochrome P450 monooxygenase-like protein n=1 Tax=Macrophomina phaseolina TaxID=35725 RepID=A0ABQ8GPQ9_9PEZI|nr:cytochrome P450 monooxygenase-like protein [Macrophomina phaseolina]
MDPNCPPKTLDDVPGRQPAWPALLILVAVAGATWCVYTVVYNLYFHPLARFPGPPAAAATGYWKAWIECVLEKSFVHELEVLHARYGRVVRVGPNELHFSDPQAYHDIYNNKNRWDKERNLYHSFGEDRSSFGFLTYREAKARKDVLNKSFSPTAIAKCESIIRSKVDALCAAFASNAQENSPSDLYYAFRCMTMDVITYLCFGASVAALQAPGFRAPILLAMDASSAVFVRFKHSALYKTLITSCPPRLAVVLSPATRGMIDLQTLLRAQIRELVRDPERALDGLPHDMTIYHRLMDPSAYRGGDGEVPGEGSLYEEAQALMFGGADTVGNALMVGSFHLLREGEKYERLKQELEGAWPVLEGQEAGPSAKELAELPYLDAVIKEALRMSSGVVAGLLRVVPKEGAVIAGMSVPGGTVVSCSSTFVHFNTDIFPEPHSFRPERWLESPELENWLVAFSRGPRMCLGINLAWAELRLCFAHVYRKFDMSLAESSPKELEFRDTFLPAYQGEHVKAYMRPASA